MARPDDSTPVKQLVIAEPLSDRELDVLRLLATDLNGPELARELMVSLSTLRTHTSNIYGKLGVNNRRAAVRRARRNSPCYNPTGSTPPPQKIITPADHHLNHHI